MTPRELVLLCLIRPGLPASFRFYRILTSLAWLKTIINYSLLITPAAALSFYNLVSSLSKIDFCADGQSKRRGRFCLGTSFPFCECKGTATFRIGKIFLKNFYETRAFFMFLGSFRTQKRPLRHRSGLFYVI